jgi:hypothetical protein
VSVDDGQWFSLWDSDDHVSRNICMFDAGHEN